jgi:hypothetical protein
MPRDGALTLSDVRRPTLSIICEPCGRRGTYNVARLMELHGDAKLTDLLQTIANCPKSHSPRRSGPSRNAGVLTWVQLTAFQRACISGDLAEFRAARTIVPYFAVGPSFPQLESRHRKDTALPAVGIDKGREDRARRRCIGRIGGCGDAVQADIVERPPIDRDAADSDDRAVLPHANDRVVASVGDVEVGAIIQRRVARPVGVVLIPLDRRQVDRQIQHRRADPGDRSEAEHLVRRAADLACKR